MITSNGSFYEGDWIKNKRVGQGRHIYSNGDYYEGQWENDECNGLGTFIDVESHSKYIGN